MTRAFSLIETVIIIALMTIMMLALANLYFNFNSLYAYQQTFVATTRSAGLAINALGAAVLPADQVLISHTFSNGTFSSGTTVLVLELPTVDTSGSVVSGAHDYIAFYLTGTDLYELTAADSTSARTSGTKKIATLVDSLTFTYDNSDFTKVTNVATDIVAKLAIKQGVAQTHLHETFYLRNI